MDREQFKKLAEVRHIWVEVNTGRGGHGDFLRTFALAYCYADSANEMLLQSVSDVLIEKYGLKNYLDNFCVEAYGG